MDSQLHYSSQILICPQTESEILKKVLVLVLGLVLVALVYGAPAWADGVVYNDPANLHVGPGAGTACATGCAGDPNTISPTAFDIYYNSQGRSEERRVGKGCRARCWTAR